MTASSRYDFDPQGRAQTRVADWEREIATASLARAALKARETRRKSSDTGFGTRLAHLVAAARHIMPQVRLAH